MAERKVTVITDADGRKIVMINDILFKGRKIDWNLVKDYLKRFVGDCYEVEQSSEKIYIGGKLPDEYTGSESRISLKKVEAKAKANVAQGIPELIETATNPIWEENKKLKHERDPNTAGTGTMYDLLFPCTAMPVSLKDITFSQQDCL